ncbi:MAG: prepilin-type N-terminal cleavage/methylation domain-containing protein [Nitrospirota bacterium]|nr:prepilin-type N-terminal cleavage/methylation domain-containing protein [Nitrospirota bacterium]
MGQTVLRNSKGVSLIEVLIAILLLAIVSLAILQSSLIAYRQTTTNQLREEALRVAEETVNAMRALAFTQSLMASELTAGVKAPTTVLRSLRGYQVSYTVQRTVTDLGTAPDLTAKQIEVTVSWQYRGQTYTHAVTSILGRS